MTRPPARVLFYSLPLHGHVNPSLPLVRELVRRGDDITYVGTDGFANDIAGTGARFIGYRNTYLSGMASAPLRTEELVWLLMQTTGEVLDAELDAARALAPDYVITDSVAPWGIWIGLMLGVPIACSVSTFAFNRAFLRWAMAGGARPKGVRGAALEIWNFGKAIACTRRLKSRYRVRGPGLMATMMGHSAGLNVVYTSRAFQPRAETFGEKYVFIGPSMAERPVPDVPALVPPTRPLVYVSLGTLFNRDASFFSRCVQAFGDRRDVDVLISIGRNVSVESLGVLPANVVVRPFVPQLEVLRHASAFVSHAGMNSVNESLYCGVPLVLIPQMSEQAMVARRVHELGAGLILRPEDATVEQLRSSVERLLREPAFRLAAQAIGRSLQSSGGVSEGADALQGFARAAGRRVESRRAHSS